MSKIKSNEETIHLSSLLPSNIISEIDEIDKTNSSDLDYTYLNEENKKLKKMQNFNSTNCFCNQNNENVSDMDLGHSRNEITNPNTCTSLFSSFFHEENEKEQLKQKSSKNINNIVNYNIPNIIKNININNNQGNLDKFLFGYNNKNNNINYFPDVNKNQIFNLSGNNNRFMEYFKKNKDNSMPDNYINYINKANTNILNNNMSNSINKNENYIYNNINFYNNKYIKFEYSSNNMNYIIQNNIIYNNQNNFYNINNTNYININNNKNNNNFNSKKELNINNNINTANQNHPNINANNQDFLNYVNNLHIPLIKFLCTKKGISEMENYLEKNGKNIIEILIYLLNKEGLTKLMKHKFGNYFIQEIIKDAKYPQIKLILELISKNFVEISESNAGTHVLQTLLDKVCNFELRNLILKSIENKELEMAFNNNATYVLQKIIGIIPDIERLNLNKILINNIIKLALDSDCVFIAEKFISTITITDNKNKIQNIIYQNFIELATSPFGNYLIQFLFLIWKGDDIDKINNIIIDNANYLAKQRYSSNIIEKTIEIFNSKNKAKLIRSLSLGGDILDTIKNQYGHYVINKAVKYMDENLKKEIETVLNSKMPEMTKKEKSKSKKFILNLKNNGINKKFSKNSKK